MKVTLSRNIVSSGRVNINLPDKDLVIKADIRTKENVFICARHLVILKKIDGLNIFLKSKEDFVVSDPNNLTGKIVKISADGHAHMGLSQDALERLKQLEAKSNGRG